MIANEIPQNNIAATPTTYSNVSDTFEISQSFENQLNLEPAPIALHKQSSQGNSNLQPIKV